MAIIDGIWNAGIHILILCREDNFFDFEALPCIFARFYLEYDGSRNESDIVIVFAWSAVVDIVGTCQHQLWPYDAPTSKHLKKFSVYLFLGDDHSDRTVRIFVWLFADWDGAFSFEVFHDWF